MTLAILGRQPGIALAELESIFGADAITRIAPQAAIIAKSPEEVLQHPLGSTMKLAHVIDTSSSATWEKAAKKLVRYFEKNLPTGKLTLGISAYNFTAKAHEVQKTGLIIKQRLKNKGASVRLIPNSEAALNTAQVLHNKLGTAANKQEAIIVATDDGQAIIGSTVQVQDITAYTFRDRNRPRRDAYVGMLPPKLAQTMINLTGLPTAKQPRLLDPFCGTGVVLQEAALLGYDVYGSDISERMIRYTQENLEWLQRTHKRSFSPLLEQADATTHTWQAPITVVVGETYLGKPFSSEPDQKALTDTRHECHQIIKAFLKNLAPQLQSGTRLCLAVPAWHTSRGVQHISVLDDLENIGYNRIDFIHAPREEMIYHREGQIVGRELLVLIKE